MERPCYANKRLLSLLYVRDGGSDLMVGCNTEQGTRAINWHQI